MNKLQMAHDYLKVLLTQNTSRTVGEAVETAYALADAMQAEADKRNNKEPCDKNIGLDSSVLKPSNSMELEWQPDWSQAPDDAKYWAMDWNGLCNWYKNKPEIYIDQWDFGGVIESSKSFGYIGNWQDSLRKRPQ